MKVSGRQSTDEVVLECLDGSFCCVDAMIRWLDKLPLASLSFQEGFDGPCCLVVCHVEGWFVAFGLEFVEHFFECCDDSGIFEVWARFSKNSISVIIIRDKILHALKRRDWKCASHVSVKGAGRRVSQRSTAEDIACTVAVFYHIGVVNCCGGSVDKVIVAWYLAHPPSSWASSCAH